MSEIQKISSLAAWTASELEQSSDWVYLLSVGELSELDACLSLCRGKSVEDIKQKDFPLKDFKKVIETQFSEQLESGVGALLIKGIDASKYAEEELAKLFWGIGLYLGKTVSQSIQGEHLHEVKDEGYKLSDKKARGTNTNIKLWFHNDPCDVAGLMCVRQAKTGGESQIVSSIAIHNAMLVSHSELVDCLYSPYYFMRHNVNTTQVEQHQVRPIFSIEQGSFACNILRPLIDRAQALAEVPKMTSKEVEALDVFEKFAESSELCHMFTLDPGDILLVNNFVTLHSRKSFDDYEAVDKKRLLFRLWLSTPNSRPLPKSFSITYHDVSAGAYRGGFKKEV